MQTYNIRRRSVDERRSFRPLIVTYRNGAPMRLSRWPGIDDVEDDKQRIVAVQQDRVAATISLSVMRQPGSNTIQVTDAIRAAAADVSAPSCRRRCTWRSAAIARNIREAFSDIQFTMLVTLALVVA